MRGRTVENLYGCLYGLLRFMRSWPEDAQGAIFNPDMQSHGWESKYTTLVILCRASPLHRFSAR